MNDRELLEAAAKAAGLNSHRYCEAWNSMNRYTTQDGYFGPNWNPLTDDGDALRLSVKLGLDVSHNSFGNVIADHHTLPRRKTIVMAYGADPCEATRRAIVLAAAAMAVR